MVAIKDRSPECAASSAGAVAILREPERYREGANGGWLAWNKNLVAAADRGGHRTLAARENGDRDYLSIFKAFLDTPRPASTLFHPKVCDHTAGMRRHRILQNSFQVFDETAVIEISSKPIFETWEAAPSKVLNCRGS